MNTDLHGFDQEGTEITERGKKPHSAGRATAEYAEYAEENMEEKTVEQEETGGNRETKTRHRHRAINHGWARMGTDGHGWTRMNIAQTESSRK